MDYDQSNVASVYDAGRGYDPEALTKCLDIFSAFLPKEGVSRVVDLGCGTGRFTNHLSSHFEADVAGVDPSERMLGEARKKTVRPGVEFKQAPGERLPLENEWADMVFMSMVYHHLSEPAATARECRRVLRDGGHVCLRNATVDAMETVPYMRFFPSVRSAVETQLPHRGHILSNFEDAGFRTVAHDIVVQQNSADWSGYADRISTRSDSFLSQLPDEEFDTGIAAMRDYARTAGPGEPVTEHVDYFVFQSESL